MIISLDSFNLFRKKLLFLLSFKALFIISMIFFAGIQLGPDEAQYWTWSQALDVGYYSKPPGIAWQIWIGTSLFGDTEWGVRSLAVLISFLQSWLVFELGRCVGLLPRTAFWGALFMAFSPLGILGSFFAITDGGLVLCWIGACFTLCAALDKKKEPNPIFISLWVLFGSLFKWTIFVFWIFFFIARFLYFPKQKVWPSILGLLISLLGLLPSLWWNMFHEWATFRHVFATLQGGSVHQAGNNFWDFFGAQALLVSPILFFFLLYALYQSLNQIKTVPPPLKMCAIITSLLFGFGCIFASFQKVQGNWIVFAYPTGFILLAWSLFEMRENGLKWAQWGLSLSIACGIIFFSIPTVFDHGLIPFRYNVLKHNMGWKNTELILNEQGYDPSLNFLVTDKYQTSSELSFYSKGQKRAYFLNLQEARRNQFSYWPSLQEVEKNKTGFFVWVENTPLFERQVDERKTFYKKELQNFFEEVELAGTFTIPGKGLVLFRCKNPIENKTTEKMYF